MSDSELLNQCIDVLGATPHEIRLTENGHEVLINQINVEGATRKFIIESKRNLVLIHSQGRYMIAKDDTVKKNCLKFMAKTNESLFFGNIEMNYDSGEFRFKTSQAFPGVRDARPVIAFMLEQQNINFTKLCEVLPRLLNSQIDYTQAAAEMMTMRQ